MLKPIEGQPDLFRDDETSRIINIRDFGALDRLFPFDRWEPQERPIRPPAGESWILRQWSILMHPWPEVISPSLTVMFEVNACRGVEIPLFEAARPLARPENAAIEARIEALEKALGLRGRGATTFQSPAGRFLTHSNHEIAVRVKGPADDFTLLREMTKVFSLRLEGLCRLPS
jgi:hypothetical protein